MLEETIAAIATPPGEGAIGIVRLTGPAAVSVASLVIKLPQGKNLANLPNFSLRRGQVQDQQGQILDDVLVSVMRAPQSFTGQDSVEINCHGGPYVLRSVLRAVLAQGARLAEPGRVQPPRLFKRPP